MLGLLALGTIAGSIKRANGAVPPSSMVKIGLMNSRGPYIAIIVPNSFEMNPLLQSPSFRADPNFPYLDISGMSYMCSEHFKLLFAIHQISIGRILPIC